MLGWEPQSRHDHYTPEGVHTGFTIVAHEVEWDEAEQAGALAYQEYLDNQCPGCSGQLDETTNPDIDWHGHLPTRCFKCDARLQAQEPFLKVDQATGKPVTPRIQALLWEVTKA